MHSTLRIIETTDASGPELVSLADLKVELEIDDTEQDVALTARITRYSKVIAEQCDRVFALTFAVETFTFDPAVCFDLAERFQPRQALLLTIFPIVNIESVTVDGSAITDFEFDAESGRLWRSGGAWWSGVVVVTYSGGYDLPQNAPAMLASALIETIRDKMFASALSNINPDGIRLISSGDDSVSYWNKDTAPGFTNLPSFVIEMLKPFKRAGMA